ncbi:MAG: hypothetical protein U0T84_01490 [Chitinophagales bacterium]
MVVDYTGKAPSGWVQLPLSKSESNRWLILQALAGNQIQMPHISDARDTRLLQQALKQTTFVTDVADAGTAMRFLCAYYCASGQHRMLKGTLRMHQRPIGELVKALMQLGFRIDYLGTPGFPPLECIPVNQQKIGSEVRISGSISSQYISALLLIGAFLPHGISIQLTDALVSAPYVELTLACLQQCGIAITATEQGWQVAPQQVQPITARIGADWSAASYFYALAALSPQAQVSFPGLDGQSAQGDKVISEWLRRLAIETSFLADGTTIKKTNGKVEDENWLIDFTRHPDVAMTMMVIAAARGLKWRFTGLDSLRIKETDRLAAMQHELSKTGVTLQEEAGVFSITGAFKLQPGTRFATYGDHRMAMAFAPLGVLAPVDIEAPEVVEKSFPLFWQQLQQLFPS